jgi:hypothetical protein
LCKLPGCMCLSRIRRAQTWPDFLFCPLILLKVCASATPSPRYNLVIWPEASTDSQVTEYSTDVSATRMRRRKGPNRANQDRRKTATLWQRYGLSKTPRASAQQSLRTVAHRQMSRKKSPRTTSGTLCPSGGWGVAGGHFGAAWGPANPHTHPS